MENLAHSLFICRNMLFDENAFLADVDNLLHKQREILIVVSEGLADENGKMIADLGIVDGFGHKLAGGAAQALLR